MSQSQSATARLSLLQAAYAIARRDFTAVLFSKAFFFFLIGPLFPVIVGAVAGSIGGQVSRQAAPSEIGVAMNPADNAAMIAASENLRDELGAVVPQLAKVQEAADNPDFDPAAFLEQKRGNYAAIVAGTLDSPRFIATPGQLERWEGSVKLIAGTAQRTSATQFPAIEQIAVTTSGASQRSSRIRTAQAAQMLLFLLTMLLAGMVLSNLVEEKANKIIEILAAAVPMNAVFLGKLFAMLGVSFVGIAVWGAFGWGMWQIAGDAIVQVAGTDPTKLPAPAVGWPLFIALGIVYFAMAYLLLGALFLTIGAMANTVREVQTLSMPVTMMQLMVFFLAAATVNSPGSTMELGAVIFPLSSPFAMLARAALDPTLWTHAAALAWQGVAVLIIVRSGAHLFRSRVMKSGGGGTAQKQPLWKRLFPHQSRQNTPM